MILLVGMAVGVDYSLFYVKRARAERHRGRSQLDAVEIAAETAGHSVLVSGLAVMVSMFGLYFANDATFASLATGSIIVVAVAVLGSLTVLPALLVKLGRRIDRPRVPVLWRLTNQDRAAAAVARSAASLAQPPGPDADDRSRPARRHRRSGPGHEAGLGQPRFAAVLDR